MDLGAEIKMASWHFRLVSWARFRFTTILYHLVRTKPEKPHEPYRALIVFIQSLSLLSSEMSHVHLKKSYRLQTDKRA